MKLTPITPSDTLTIGQILDTLKLNGIELVGTNSSEFFLVHNLSVDEFENLVFVLMIHHELQPQDPDWCPGTPTNDPADYGYYICPIKPTDWDNGDFDMLITTDSITWC